MIHTQDIDRSAFFIRISVKGLDWKKIKQNGILRSTTTRDARPKSHTPNQLESFK
jgi:hypothetical protein